MERKWEELEIDCLVNVFEKLEIEDLTLGVPFVCKSWYRASLIPQCWKSVNLTKLNHGFCPFAERFSHEYRIQKFSVTGMIKFALNRGRSSVAELLLPSICTVDNLIYASNKCPCLKILGLPMLLLVNQKPILLYDKEMKLFQGIITKWKDLEYLHIQETQSYTKEILFEISRHCKNFVGLKKTGFTDDEEVLAIVNLLPTLKHLIVTSRYISREDLKMILEGCKELENLVVKKCGFEVDENILKMASHIKNFEYEDFRQDETFYLDGSESSDAEFSD